MSLDVRVLVGPDEVLAIVDDVWSALVGSDGELEPLPAPPAHLPLDAVSAWVDLVGPWSGSLVLTTAPTTAADLTRALLRAGQHDELLAGDVDDALGELANVIGGGIKSLLGQPSTLGLPRVAPGMEAPTGDLVVQLDLAWRGRPVCLSLRGAPSGAPGPRSHTREEPS